MNLSIQSKTAVICGSSQGIGFAVAKELALLGADCILLARNEDKLREVITTLDTSKGQKHKYVAVDFSQAEAAKKTIADMAKDTTVHILVNNSGGPKAGPIIDAEEDQFLSAFKQHVIINQLLVKAFVSGMKKEGYGRIINIISTSVKTPLANLGVSNTIRAAVASWAKSMSNELGQFGITVNNILPGLTKTQRLDTLVEHTATGKGISKETVSKQMMESVPAKRFGEPEEIGAVAAFLATPAASYVNGTSIPVDGGRTDAL